MKLGISMSKEKKVTQVQSSYFVNINFSVFLRSRIVAVVLDLRWPEPIYMRVGDVFDLRFFRMKDSTDFYDFWHP